MEEASSGTKREAKFFVDYFNENFPFFTVENGILLSCTCQRADSCLTIHS